MPNPKPSNTPAAPEAEPAPVEAAAPVEATAPAESAEDVAVFFDAADIVIAPKRTGGTRAKELARFEGYVTSTPAGKTRVFPDASKSFRTKISRALTRLEAAKTIASKKNYRLGVVKAEKAQADALKVAIGSEITYLTNRTPAAPAAPATSETPAS